MFIFLCLRWWYSAGWGWVWKRSIKERLAWCSSFFSVQALIRTWFSPFKQTYSKNRNKSFDGAIQTAIDNFVSRIIGTLARSVILFAGLVCSIFVLFTGVTMVVLWPFIPVLPLISLVLVTGILT